MSEFVPDHPDISWTEGTGYPSWNQPEIIRCYCCGDEITGTVYEDSEYEFLCEDCLKSLYKKDWY